METRSAASETNASGEVHSKSQEVYLFLYKSLREIFKYLMQVFMRVKMGFKGLSIPAQIERSRTIVTKMTGNVNFATPNPSLADLTTAIDALETAYNNASDGGRELKAIMRSLLRDLLELIRRLAAYVQAESGGNELIILSSGFDVVRRGLPIVVGQVLNLRTDEGPFAGSIRAIWDKTPGAGAYIVEISGTTPSGDQFSQYKVVLQTRINIVGLEPGKLYWIRVIAVGRVDYGLPSDPSPHNSSVTY